MFEVITKAIVKGLEAVFKDSVLNSSFLRSVEVVAAIGTVWQLFISPITSKLAELPYAIRLAPVVVLLWLAYRAFAPLHLRLRLRLENDPSKPRIAMKASQGLLGTLGIVGALLFLYPWSAGTSDSPRPVAAVPTSAPTHAPVPTPTLMPSRLFADPTLEARFAAVVPTRTGAMELYNPDGSALRALPKASTLVPATSRRSYTFARNDDDWFSGQTPDAKGTFRIINSVYSWGITGSSYVAIPHSMPTGGDQDIIAQLTTRAGFGGVTLRASIGSDNSWTDYGCYIDAQIDYSCAVIIKGSGKFVRTGTDEVINPGKSNVLELVANGSKLTFSVNGKTLAEFSDSQIGRGQPGLWAGSGAASSGTVVYDKVDVEVQP
jgi:hypothetical protein